MMERDFKMEELEYCRICLRRNLRLIAISKEVQINFYSLTQFELIKTFSLSPLICQACEKQLKNAKKYRDKLLDSEIKLQNELNEIQTQSILMLDKLNFDESHPACSLTIERVRDDLITDEFDLIEEENEIDPVILKKFDDDKNFKASSVDDDGCGSDDNRKENTKSEKILNEESLSDVDKKFLNPILIQNSTIIYESEKNSEQPQKNEIFDVPKYALRRFQNHPQSPKLSKSKTQQKSSKTKIELSTDGKVTCPHCHKSVIKAYIKHHIARLHFSVKNFTCDLCSRQFYKKLALKAHMNTHLNSKPFVCTHKNCEKSFASLTALGTHIRFHHTSFSSYICETCGKGYKQRRLLEEHVRSQHTGERIFKCNYEGCESGFFSHGALRKHLLKCHEDKPETCEVCGKIFKSLPNLQAHMRMLHSKITIYCDFPGCDKKFPNNCFLKNHKKVHENVRDFRCEFCDKNFIRKRHLVRHIETTHKKLHIINCKVENCGKVLSRKESYKNHLLKVHQKNKIEIERLMEDAKKCDEIIEYLDYEVLDEDLMDDHEISV